MAVPAAMPLAVIDRLSALVSDIARTPDMLAGLIARQGIRNA